MESPQYVSVVNLKRLVINYFIATLFTIKDLKDKIGENGRQVAIEYFVCDDIRCVFESENQKVLFLRVQTCLYFFMGSCVFFVFYRLLFTVMIFIINAIFMKK